MYNLDESNPSQILKYKSAIFGLYNRDFIPSESNPLGYKKEIIGVPENQNLDRNNVIIEKKSRITYKLNWELFLSETRFLDFASLINSFFEDLVLELDSSVYIYTPNIRILEKLTLVDNRLMDTLKSQYLEYNININSISPVNEFFFREKMIKFTMEATTL